MLTQAAFLYGYQGLLEEDIARFRFSDGAVGIGDQRVVATDVGPVSVWRRRWQIAFLPFNDFVRLGAVKRRHFAADRVLN